MERILASPLAKKIASDKGIQLNQGSGENGRIIKVISKTLPLHHCAAASCCSCSKTETAAALLHLKYLFRWRSFTEEIRIRKCVKS
jgi:pyruvate dehydrogenase E2 component (dihydrolipoamide acetyltransferase)